MPREDTLRLALFDPCNHVIKDGAAGYLSRHGLGELSDDSDLLPLSEETQLCNLGLDREDLSLFAVSGLTRIKEEFLWHDGAISLLGKRGNSEKNNLWGRGRIPRDLTRDRLTSPQARAKVAEGH